MENDRSIRVPEVTDCCDINYDDLCIVGDLDNVIIKEEEKEDESNI